jgi:hypothetical protein
VKEKQNKNESFKIETPSNELEDNQISEEERIGYFDDGFIPDPNIKKQFDKWMKKQ